MANHNILKPSLKILKKTIAGNWIGPGLIMAVSGIGASDIIAATIGGAYCGVSLLWVVILGTFFKFVLSEGIARWQLATGSTVLEGWSRHLPRGVLILFAIYITVWAVAVSGALTSACGLAIETLTRGKIPQSLGGLTHAVIAFLFIYFSRTKGVSGIMKPFIIMMFISIVLCAAVIFDQPLIALKGLFVPTISSMNGVYVLSLLGGIGGSLTLLSYNYLLQDEDKVAAHQLHGVRIDLGIAYLFTAIFGSAILFIAYHVFYREGIAITNQEAVSRMAMQLAGIMGSIGFYIYSIGFWAAVTASLFGVWQTIPRVFVDCYCLLRKLPDNQRITAMQIRSKEYRSALVFMFLASLPFAFLGQPLIILVVFTIIGSLFIPFLAATLLYLNNRVAWKTDVPHNGFANNITLFAVLFLFLIVGGVEMERLL